MALAGQDELILENLTRQLEQNRQNDGKNKKVSTALRALHEEFVTFQRAKGNVFKPSNQHLRLQNDLVLIEAVAIDDKDKLQQALSNLGGLHLESVNYLVSGYVPIIAIPLVEALPSLQSMRPSSPRTRSGLVTSQGDLSTRANVTRALYGIDGTGVTIGTMSDSFDCLGGAAADVSNGDLPAGIIVAQEHPSCFASDEGRAMMQIIHDLAPGSTQMFHTASGGRAAFANGIRTLANLGADIIVDDIGYPDQPFFQDGPIAQAVDEVTIQHEVVYFSAAGNDADHSYESTFRPDLTNSRFHDFNPGAGEDVFQLVFVPGGTSVQLLFQWAEPYASISGPPGAATDFDICITDDPFTSILACAVDANIGGDPIEVLNFTNFGTDDFFNIIIDRYAGAGNPLLKYIFLGPISPLEYVTNSSTVYGHPNALWAEATGAANYPNTPVYGTSPPIVASYSSIGGTPILFDLDGNSVSPSYRNKPNVTCVDAGNTTFFSQGDLEPDGWPNFFGTSAAAPHAAALAALVREFAPSLNPLEVFLTIEGAAVDMGAPGFDFQTGAGLCDAFAALKTLESPDISLSLTPSPTSLPEPGGDITFNIVVTNVGEIDVTLSELSDDAIGNLDGVGTCSVPQALATGGGSYQCSYILVGTGNAGDELPLTVTATADGPQNSDTENDTASVTITDVLPSATLSALVDPTEIPEPGGLATIQVAIQNTGTAESISLSLLTDSAIGTLNGQGTCALPQNIAPGADYQCEYSYAFSGDGEDVLVHQIDASVSDDDGNPLGIGDEVAVTITDVLPSASLDASVNPAQIEEPGGPATITLVINSTGAEGDDLNLILLTDSVLGDLDGQGTCLLPQAIPSGAPYQCEYVTNFVGSEGANLVRQIDATLQDNEANQVEVGDSITVDIIASDVIFMDNFEGN